MSWVGGDPDSAHETQVEVERQSAAAHQTVGSALVE